MTNREIYDTALALLGEVDEELCRDYEQRTPYLLGAFIGECSELGGFYRAARGEADGEVSLDFTGKKSGRGAYICRDVKCLKKAQKSRRIDKSFDREIPDEVYEKLAKELEDGE